MFLEFQVWCLTTARGLSSKQAGRYRWLSGTHELRMRNLRCSSHVLAALPQLVKAAGAQIKALCFWSVVTAGFCFQHVGFSLGVGVGFVLLFFIKDGCHPLKSEQ